MIGRIRSSRARYRDYQGRRWRKAHDPRTDRVLPVDTTRRDRFGYTTERRSAWRLIAAFRHQLRGCGRALVVILISSAIATVLGLLPLYGMKIIFDNALAAKPLPETYASWPGVPDDPRSLLWAVVTGMFVLTIFALGVRTYSNRAAFRLQRHIAVAARRRLLNHALRMPLHRLRQISSGGVSFVIRHDGNAIGDMVMFLIYEPWKAVIQLIGCFAVLAWADWRLLLGSLALLPLVYFAQRARVGRIRDMIQDTMSQDQSLDGLTSELFGGIRVIRGFGRERTVAARLVRRHHFVTRLQLLTWWLHRSTEIGWSVVIPLASGLLLGFGGLRVLHDAAAVQAGTLAPDQAFTVGTLIMFLAYLAWLLNPLASIARTSTHLQNALAGMNRAMDVFEEPIEVGDNGDKMVVDRDAVRGEVAMRGVSFTYPGSDEPVLQDIDLDVPAGHVVAFVGPSGAGKTTLTNLIARFHDPDRGCVLLDGRDIRELDPVSYRRCLALVEQDIFLFDGTIGENIACGNRRARPEQIAAAAEAAHAAEFIAELPDGYDTPVGERGLRLSGGQRQRIAIARAMLADPRVLILDEATSHLDPENEQLIQQSLATLMAGRTSFVIAHRLSTIRHADTIVILEDGRITERGPHEELMVTSPRYRRMIELQIGDENGAGSDKSATDKPRLHRA